MPEPALEVATAGAPNATEQVTMSKENESINLIVRASRTLVFSKYYQTSIFLERI